MKANYRSRLLQFVTPEGIQKLRGLIVEAISRSDRPILLGSICQYCDGQNSFWSLDAISEICSELIAKGMIIEDDGRFKVAKASNLL